jgi:FkbM family methyltransferase
VLGQTADALIARFGWWRGLRLFGKLRLARFLPSGTIVTVAVPGMAARVQLRARTSDGNVLKELLVRGEYDAIRPQAPRFIVDAGANIGLVSALLATRYPDARIVALEIDVDNFELLKRNVRAYPNVVPLNAGLWSHATQLVIENPEARAWAFRARERLDGGAALASVPGLGVNDLLHQFSAPRIDLLKIDIEGGELELFGPEAEQWLDRVDLIAIELHDRFVPGCETVVASRLSRRFVRRRSGRAETWALDVFERVRRAP